MSWARDLGADVRFGLRLHRRGWRVALVIVTSLALGIGVNTALFSLADVLLLRALPVAEPERLVEIYRQGPGGQGPVLSYPVYKEMRAAAAGQADLLATARVWRWNLGAGAAAPERIAGELVSGNYFAVLGVRPALGRVLGAADEGAGRGVVLSHAYWQRRFAGDPAVLGRVVTINGAAVTVVGVAARGFAGVEVADPVDLWAPLGLQPEVLLGASWLPQPGLNWLRVLARRAPGVSPAGVAGVAHAAFRHSLAARGEGASEERMLVREGRRGISPLHERIARPMAFLAVLVGLVLLLACLNVTTLQLARAEHRQRELAVRAALGGGRGRLVRQLLTENLLLGLAGAACGWLLAWFTRDLLLGLLFPQGERLPVEVALSGRVLAFSAALGVGSGLIAGLLPARAAGRIESGDIKRAGRTVTAGAGLGLVLPAAQIALSSSLLLGTFLCARSLHALGSVDPGFDRTHVLAVRLDAQALRYDQAQFAALYRRLLDAAAALPGVSAVGLADQPLFAAATRQRNISVEGFAWAPGVDLNPYVMGVSPGFLASVGVPLVAGRGFVASDNDGVAVVNRSFARFYFGDPARAVGRRFGFGGARAARDLTIVGVAEDSKYSDLRERSPQLVYTLLGPGQFPTRAFSYSETTLTLRTAGDPGQLREAARRAIAGVDASLPVVGIATLSEQVERSLGQDRLVAALAALFGALALVLTATGIYGVLSHGVARRLRELGVRLALGARPAALHWLVARRSLVMLGAGLLIGLPAALALARIARGALFGVAPADPVALAFTAGGLVLLTLLASYGPTRAAARVDPMVALRSDD